VSPYAVRVPPAEIEAFSTLPYVAVQPVPRVWGTTQLEQNRA
jgi:hypothetical protein